MAYTMILHPGDQAFPACMRRPVLVIERLGSYGTILLRLLFAIEEPPDADQPHQCLMQIGMLAPYSSDSLQLSLFHPVREHFAPFDGMTIQSSRIDIDNLKAWLLVHANMMVGR